MAMIWEQMGFIRWPLAFATLWIFTLSMYSTVRLYRPSAEADLRTKAWVDGVLFWGAFAAIAGVLGTLIGFVIAAQSIEQAGQLATPLIWGGMKVAMLSSVTGVLLLAMSSLAWFGLQLRWRFLQAREDD